MIGWVQIQKGDHNTKVGILTKYPKFSD